MKRRGSYVTLPAAKLSRLMDAIHSPSFKTSTAVARHAGVSRTTVSTRLKELLARGVIAEDHRLLQVTHGGRNPSIALKISARQQAMIKFAKECGGRSVPVSINMLQAKFGGTKADAKAALAHATMLLESSLSPIMRRTKSSQPKRRA